ncbi:MAG: insulinase family protein, partial [candidate division Zixibacteria bacterium]|nr:insulinase family protein [candidate division Zixibacteria bacterium]
TVKCDDIYYSEKLHFYSFIIAPLMMSAGWDFVQHYPERLQQVSWDQCRDAAREWLSQPNYVVTVVKPVGKSGKVGFKPEDMTADDVIAHFDTAVFTDYDISQGIELTYPETDSIGFELIGNAQYYREVLPNGLTVIIKSSPDSRVFAMNVLGKNRTACEPPGKEGITDFVNHCIERGTATRSSKELSRDLSRIGANVSLYDNPWIPMDDRYTTRRFSFMKFETIEEYAEKGFYLFTEMLCYPSFDSQEVAGVRRSLLATLGRNTTSPRKTARNLFFENLFEGHNYSRPISGTLASVTSITPADLHKYHSRFYSPENMILCIGTSRSAETVMQWINRSLGRMTAAGFTAPEITPPESVSKIRTVHNDLESEQISMYLGGILPGANDDDAVAIKVATSILSSRLYLNLREKQGLAYSIGAGSVFDRDFGWTYSVISTASENYQQALDGILLEIEKLKLDGPTRSEIVSACNQLWGSLIRAKLSRINQAYYLSVDEYLGRPLGYDQKYLSELSQVTTNSVRRVMTSYFSTDRYILTSAGRKP